MKSRLIKYSCADLSLPAVNNITVWHCDRVKIIGLEDYWHFLHLRPTE